MGREMKLCIESPQTRENIKTEVVTRKGETNPLTYKLSQRQMSIARHILSEHCPLPAGRCSHYRRKVSHSHWAVMMMQRGKVGVENARDRPTAEGQDFRADDRQLVLREGRGRLVLEEKH